MFFTPSLYARVYNCFDNSLRIIFRDNARMGQSISLAALLRGSFLPPYFLKPNDAKLLGFVKKALVLKGLEPMASRS